MPQHAQLPLWDEKSDPEKLETLRQMILDLYGYQLQAANQQMIDDLSRHVPEDDKEAQDVAFIIDLIQKYPNILNQNCEIGHITASALVIDLDGRRVLLHFHKSLNRWLQVGGHADYETRPHEIALREAREESGLTDLAFFPDAAQPTLIDVDAHTIPTYRNCPQHWHLDFRYLLTTRRADEIQAAQGESSRFLWVPLEEIEGLAGKVDASLLRFLRKARRLFESRCG